MLLSFNVEKQIITRTDTEKVVTNSMNYLYAQFTFTDEWVGEKTAVFKGKHGTYNALLDADNKCLVPWEILTEAMFDVSVFCGDLITANAVKIFTIQSGYEIGDESRIPTPEIYTQVINKLNEIEAEVDPEAIERTVDEYLADKEIVTEDDVEAIVSRYISDIHGIPTGGTTGQVLTKKSNSDYDTEWKTAEDVLYPYVDTPFVLNEKAYINKSGRKVTTQGAQWKYSNPIAVTRGQNIKFTASGFETNLAMIATCDIEGNDISVKVVSEQNPSGGSFYYKTYEYEVTDDGYIVLSCNTQGGEPSLQIKNGVLNANSLISETTFSALCHAFKKVVCAGDSYTEGRIYRTTSEEYVDEPNYSWVKYMNDLTGNEWINCGASGATAKLWQTNNKGLPKAQAEGVVQAYVIGLGINDSSSESYGLPVGTESDIGTNNDTYYAQLSKVIVELATISPNAYIFVNTCPFYDANRIAPYNVAIKAIVEHFKGTYKIHCIDLASAYAYLFYAPNFTSMFYKGHPTADGQAAIAKKYEFALSNYMKQHEANFRDIPWTPYGT